MVSMVDTSQARWQLWLPTGRIWLTGLIWLLLTRGAVPCLARLPCRMPDWAAALGSICQQHVGSQCCFFFFPKNTKDQILIFLFFPFSHKYFYFTLCLILFQKKLLTNLKGATAKYFWNFFCLICGFLVLPFSHRLHSLYVYPLKLFFLLSFSGSALNVVGGNCWWSSVVGQTISMDPICQKLAMEDMVLRLFIVELRLV